MHDALCQSRSAMPASGVLDDAASILRRGGIVAYLTDTVYGLAVNARLPQAIAGLYALKGRSSDKAIPLIIGAPEQLSGVAVAGRDALKRSWRHSGPARLRCCCRRIRTCRPRCSATPDASACAGRLAAQPRSRAARRQCHHRFQRQSLGAAAALSAAEVEAQLAPDVDLILDAGRANEPQVSTILDITVEPPRMIRAGKIPQEAIESVLGCGITKNRTEKG